MTTARCVSAIKAQVMRITRLDGCGKPVVGPNTVLSSDGFISVKATADVESGQEFLQKKANGDLCINERDCDILKRYNLEIDFCKVDPEAVEMTTGQRLLLEGGVAKGFALGENVQCDTGWSLELWQKLAGAECDLGGDPEWLYWCWPWITGGTIGDLTFESAPFQFGVAAYTKAIGADDQWGTDNRGPLLVLPASAGLESGEHVGNIITSVQPPEDTCGAAAYDPEDTAPVTAFTSTPTGLDVDFDGTGSTGTGLSYAWAFGDTQSGIGATPSHTYEGAGTYTVVLTVTDSNGFTDSISHDVTVS